MSAEVIAIGDARQIVANRRGIAKAREALAQVAQIEPPEVEPRFTASAGDR